jgi:predicted nucleotide-binding protein
MTLPIRTIMSDVTALCGYLATKPIGATVSEAKAVIDSSVLDGRKINCMKIWGLVESDEASGKIKLTDLGRALAKNKFAHKADCLRQSIRRIPAYMAVIERAIHSQEYTTTTNDVAALWHKHFSADASESERILNDQAVCFFQLAEGADLGKITIGRQGHPTRIDFVADNIATMIDGAEQDEVKAPTPPVAEEPADDEPTAQVIELPTATTTPAPAATATSTANNRVFITHGKNKKILDQVKEIVQYGGFEAVVAMERETTAKPVPEKVFDEMRKCRAAVIHVAVDDVIVDKDGKEHPQINGNVLIEIGAAMGLYPGYKFILLVEEGLKLPSNLQGLYECRYSGNELTAGATMKLLKAFNEFKSAA